MFARSMLRIPLVAGVVAGALMLAGCGGTQDDSDATGQDEASTPKITIGLTYTPNIQFSPFYLAESTGAFERAGVDVTLRHHGTNESLFGALEGGEEDIVVAGGAEMMQARSQGVDVASFATMYEQYPAVLIVPEDSPIQKPADLRGRTVGLPGEYGENWFGMLALLDAAGMTRDDLTIQSIGYTLQSAIATRSVDAVIGFVNNDAVQMNAADVRVRTIPLIPDGQPPLLGNGLGALDETIEQDAEALEGVVEALREVMAGPGLDAEQVIEASRPHVPGLDDPDAEERARLTWEATLPLYGETPFGAPDLERFTLMKDFLTQIGVIEGDVDADAVATSRITDALN